MFYSLNHLSYQRDSTNFRLNTTNKNDVSTYLVRIESEVCQDYTTNSINDYQIF